MILNNDITAYENELNQLLNAMKIEYREFKESVKNLPEQIKTGVKVPEIGIRKHNKRLMSSLKEAELIKKEIAVLLLQNTQLVEKIELVAQHKANENMFS
ncbi:hypothetical protein QE152_g32314 [Popillia japonica]|uniref:Uncharacterized protein n=1 Tax=Popillia japonica TaxID=7064 RepID=A0AAW1IZZ1_POPJA